MATYEELFPLFFAHALTGILAASKAPGDLAAKEIAGSFSLNIRMAETYAQITARRYADQGIPAAGNVSEAELVARGVQMANNDLAAIAAERAMREQPLNQQQARQPAPQGFQAGPLQGFQNPPAGFAPHPAGYQQPNVAVPQPGAFFPPRQDQQAAQQFQGGYPQQYQQPQQYAQPAPQQYQQPQQQYQPQPAPMPAWQQPAPQYQQQHAPPPIALPTQMGNGEPYHGGNGNPGAPPPLQQALPD